MRKLYCFLILLLFFSNPGHALSAESAPGGFTSPEDGIQNLSLGWKYFNDGNYQFAVNSFKLAQRHPESSLDARFGLGLSQMKLGNRQEAIDEFEYLVGKGFKVPEVLPPLIWLLLEDKRYEKAEKYLVLVNDDSQKRQWQSMVDTGLFSAKAEAAIDRKNQKSILAAVKRYYHLLYSCEAPYVFFNSARALEEEGMKDEAEGILNGILRNCPEDMELRGLALSELGKIVSLTDMTARINEERDRYPSDSGYMARLDSIEASVLMARLERLEPSSEEAYSTVKRINELLPEDAGMTSRMSWDSLNLKNFEKAHRGFSGLLDSNPDSAEYALGLSYSLLALNRYKEALSVSERFMDKADDFRAISRNAHAGLGRQAYHSRKYRSAIEHYSIVLRDDPANEEALSLTAWSHYNSGDFKEALPYFTRNFQAGQSPDYVMPILSIYEASDPDKASSFTEELAGSDKPETVKALADYFYSKGRVITAAQVTAEGPGTCYYNADRPRLEGSFASRSKSGDPGLSKLREDTSSLRIHYPVSGGRALSLSLMHTGLDSGDAPDGVFAGSFYLATPQPGGMTNTASLVEAELRYEKEGSTAYHLSLGSSPSGGEASASPVFSFEVRSSRWDVEIHRSPVRDSILSYSGARDPYSPSWWGGVLKSGIRGSISTNPTERYIYTFEAGYDFYDGERVMDNRSYNGTVSVAMPISGERADMVVGGFLTFMGFDKDENHFTFGHGGYFSPQSFLAVGPSLRISAKPCKTLSYDLQASASYMSHKTDSSPHYPLDSILSPGEYPGDRFSGLGFSLKAGARKLLSNRWSAALSLSADNSSDYDQWSAGIALRYLAGGRSAVLP